MKKPVVSLLMAAVVVMWTSFSQAEIAVVVHPENALSEMSAEQVAAIYLGKDVRLRPLDLPESERLRHWFYFKVTGRDASQVNIVRAQRIAQMPPRVAANSMDAVRRVAANKYAIAYVDRRAVDASVKVVMTIQNPTLLDRRAQE